MPTAPAVSDRPPPRAPARVENGKFAAVHDLVRRIPKGRVTTYGWIAREVSAGGFPLSARAAGWALGASPPGVPWHRVVNAEGALSAERSGRCPAGRQRSLLEREGVRFDERGRVPLARYLWPPSAAGGGGDLSAPPEDFR